MAPTIPSAAWKRRFDARLEKPGKAGFAMTLPMIIKMLPAFIRMQRSFSKLEHQGFDPINMTRPPQPGPTQGVPVGGLGGGSIGRGWRGEFRRWQMRPGFVHHSIVWADAFSVRVARPGQPPQAVTLLPGRPENGALSAWNWGLDESCAAYHALFPRAWTVYEQPLPGIRLTCRQVSPVIPHNYKESSYPAGVFVWEIENLLDEPLDTSLMFTWQNGYGQTNDTAGGHSNRLFELDNVSGVALKHLHRQRKFIPDPAQAPARPFIYEDPLTFAIAAEAGPGIDVTCRGRVDLNGDGSEIWTDFLSDGRLETSSDARPSAQGECIGAAVAAAVRLGPREKRELVFSLAWDMPLVRTGTGTEYYRRYTLFYGCDGKSAPRLARDAVQNYRSWEEKISAWQQPILSDPSLPDWYKMALFNELYFLVDGGTLWAYPASLLETSQRTPTQAETLGRFAYLEGHEYQMYNTYDVHFYASFALAMLWPEIEFSIQRDFAAAVTLEQPEMRMMAYTGDLAPRKIRGTVPHDLGWPSEDFWNQVNGYNFHDSNQWKDLNPKFVLQVYRDYAMEHDYRFARETWPAVDEAMQFMLRYDTDGDGLIENSGIPDQTYDAWTVTGPSAYTGALWLAALSAAAALAEVLGLNDRAVFYRDLLSRAAQAYEEKLWNGSYYDYDSSRSRQHNSIMADQLAGQWFALAAGLPPVVSMEHYRIALQTIYASNVLGFENGTLGAVNGVRPDGKIDRTSLQSQEAWSGVTYALAAAMLQVGMDEQAFATARGVVEATYERLGYWFQTPEAWDRKGNFRSAAYMRPLAIWAIQWQLELRRRRRNT